MRVRASWKWICSYLFMCQICLTVLSIVKGFSVLLMWVGSGARHAVAVIRIWRGRSFSHLHQSWLFWVLASTRIPLSHINGFRSCLWGTNQGSKIHLLLRDWWAIHRSCLIKTKTWWNAWRKSFSKWYLSLIALFLLSYWLEMIVPLEERTMEIVHEQKFQVYLLML